MRHLLPAQVAIDVIPESGLSNDRIGAQIRAGRALLGWSQADLAQAADVAVETVRHWEAQHGKRLHPTAAKGFGPTRIAQALRRAGIVIRFDPVGVEIDPNLYEGELRPPIYTRWEKYWRSNSRRAQAKCRQEFRLLAKAIPRL